MKLTAKQKREITNLVKKELSEMHGISIKEAESMILRSTLKEKYDRTPAFIAHCSKEQLADLVSKDAELTLV